MIKLKRILNENEEPRNFSPEVKKHFLEIVSTYNKYQEMMDRKSDIVEVAETLGGIIEAAKELAINEADDWFDKHTVKRNMNELSKLGSQFEKVVAEAKALDQRLNGLYEDMGHILSRYYKIGEITEEEMKSRLGIRNEGKLKKKNQSVNEEIYWVNSNNKSELAKFYDEVKNFMPDHSIQKLSPLSIQFDISKKDLADVEKMAKSYKGLKVVKESVKSIKEGFTPQDIENIKKVVDKEKRLIGLGPIFKRMGWYTDFVMMDGVPPHLKLKKKKGDKETYLLVNKKYVDKPDWVSGEIAGGLDENTQSGCNTCGKSKPISEEIKYSPDGYVKMIKNDHGSFIKSITLNGVTYRYNSVYHTYNSVKNNELLHKSDLST